jgi:hypothetical protein
VNKTDIGDRQNPTLVTPTKNNIDYEQLNTSRSIHSGHATSAILGQVTSRLVCPSRGTVHLGQQHIYVCILFFRVQPGECYHLYTKAREMTLADYPLPEMLRTRLDEVILQIKILQLGKAKPFLERVMDPPDPRAVELSIKVHCIVKWCESLIVAKWA